MSNEIPDINMNIVHSHNIQSNADNAAPVRINNKPNEQQGNAHAKQPKPEQIADIVKTVNNTIHSLNQEVKFSYNESIKSLVVNVVESKTGKLIRQIPPEDVINLQKKMSEVMGLIFDNKGV